LQDASDDKAMRRASYLVNGLEKVLWAALNAQQWDTALPEAFRHCLTAPIKFERGCGALSWRLPPDNRILPLRAALKLVLIETPKSATRRMYCCPVAG